MSRDSSVVTTLIQNTELLLTATIPRLSIQESLDFVLSTDNTQAPCPVQDRAVAGGMKYFLVQNKNNPSEGPAGVIEGWER